MKYYANKRVLITGGASGIGRLLALKIAAAGARTAICDIDAPGMEKVRSEAAAKGLSVVCFPVDLSRREQIDVLAGAVREKMGGVDILFNNAGIVSGKPFLECSDNEIERSLAINLTAHIWTIRAFLPGMIEQGAGHLVTIASAAALSVLPVWPIIRPANSPASGWTKRCAVNSASAASVSIPL